MDIFNNPTTDMATTLDQIGDLLILNGVLLFQENDSIVTKRQHIIQYILDEMLVILKKRFESNQVGKENSKNDSYCNELPGSSDGRIDDNLCSLGSKLLNEKSPKETLLKRNTVSNSVGSKNMIVIGTENKANTVQLDVQLVENHFNEESQNDASPRANLLNISSDFSGTRKQLDNPVLFVVNDTDHTIKNLAAERENDTSKYLKDMHQCYVCGKCFLQKKTLDMHITIHTEIRQNRKKKKPRVTYKPSNITESPFEIIKDKSKPQPNEYQCVVCDKVFDKLKHLRIHLSVHEKGNKALFCQRCKKTFSSQDRLQNHNFQCEIKFKKKDGNFDKTNTVGNKAVFDHIKSVDQEKKNEICEESFPSMEYSCVDCGDDFKTIASLELHRKCHQDLEQFTLYCKVCTKKFITANALKQHFKVHQMQIAVPKLEEIDTIERTCKICCRTFVTMNGLREHETKCKSNLNPEPLIVVRNILPDQTKKISYACPLCMKVFYKSSHLTDHMFCHSDKRNFVCDVCGKGFKRKYSLNRHRKAHGEISKRVCLNCNGSFVHHHHFLRHLKNCKAVKEVTIQT